MALLWPLSLPAQNANDHSREYTEEHPLVYIDTWDLPPYIFLNEMGEPDGYTVDVLKLLLNELKIPYVIKLKPTLDAQSDFRSGASDLIVNSDKLFPQMYASTNVVLQYTFSLAYPKTMIARIDSLSQLAGYQFYVRNGSRYYQHIKKAGLENQAIQINDMGDALKKVSSDLQGLVLWNTLSIKWVLQKYQIDNLKLSSIDIPQVGYRLLSPDSALTARLDSAYTILNASERLQPLQAKWFYPERVKETKEMPRWVWYLVGAAALAAVLSLIFNSIYRKRERKANELLHQRNNRLALILQVSKVNVWTYDVKKNLFTWFDSEGRPSHVLTPQEAIARCHPAIFNKITEGIEKIKSKQAKELTIEVRDTPLGQTDDTSLHDYVTILSVLQWEHDEPAVILGVKSDLTEQKDKERHSKEMLHRYQSIFSTSMVDMIFYDQDGYITNMNQRAQNTFKMDLQETLKEGVNLKQIITVDNFDFDHFEYYHATEFLNTQGEKRDIKSRKLEGVMYYELQLIAMRDKEGRMQGVFGTGRDVSEVARSYHKIQEGVKRLQEANKAVAKYINNINYVMKVGGIRMANYNPDTHTMTLYEQSDVPQLELTQTRSLHFVDEQNKRDAMRMLKNMDNKSDKPIDTTLLTTLRMGEDRHPLYLQFQFIPIYDNNGKLHNYFGMCRDVSDIKANEKQLERETDRAQEVESLKNSFLRNMSYEIRTPLSTVMGFAELLEMEHTPEDEKVFISEMKDNSAYLLHLINDILFLSRLDAHMIEINPQPIDFAVTFESHCSMGWTKYQQEGVHFSIENPYEHLIVNIDDANLGRIIEQVAVNAAQHTESGRVSARYEYVADKLIITIEDTGCGMSKETLDNIYKRFSSNQKQSTGLGMPICRELAEQMGGTIDINSQEGKGTTVWISMPCEVQSIDRKKV